MQQPFFSILLPLAGSSELARDALESVLRQDFTSFEIIASNNGSNNSIRALVREFQSDGRIFYQEYDRVLSMPDHWELISKKARGKHQLVLTNRSVLKIGALSQVAHIHECSGADVVTWPWDLYYEDEKIGIPYEGGIGIQNYVEIDSKELVRGLVSGSDLPRYQSPRGLNSSVASSLVAEIRRSCGNAFGRINPDYSFAYRCLFRSKTICHSERAMMISQGLSSGNGAKGYQGDFRDYANTLDFPIQDWSAPIQEYLLENSIASDLVRVAEELGHKDVVEEMSWDDVFVRCINEYNVKREAGLVSQERLTQIRAAIDAALALQSLETQRCVASQTAGRPSFRHIIAKVGTYILGRKAMLAMKRGVFFRKRGSYFASVQEAAGY